MGNGFSSKYFMSMIFLSHSHHNKDFVRKLYASLSSLGAPIFLDEKDIKIGDSIPKKIEDGVESSSFFIYVLSKYSVSSPWVRHELDMAHVKLMESQGYRLIPMLIEDIEVPRGISYIKYSDFRWWEIPEKYYRALDILIADLDLKKENPKLADDNYLPYIQNISSINSIYNSIKQSFRILDYALDVASAAQEGKSESGYYMKMCFKHVYFINLQGSLIQLKEFLLALAKNSRTPTLTNLKKYKKKKLRGQEAKGSSIILTL